MPARMRTLLLWLPIAALGACDAGTEPAAPVGKRAEGEVLGGTISDDMIALEELRSQSPPMRVAPSDEASSGSAGDGSSSPPEPAASESDAQAEPAAPASDDEDA